MTDYTLHCGDVLDVASRLPDNTYNAVFCDPPYGIKFMGKRWDHGVPSVAVWEQVYRVCKPGAVLMAFAGTRTWHRLAVNIEDAGWQMWDTLMYVYGSGFPKSANISKLIDSAAGAEREVVGVHDSRGDYDGRQRTSPAMNNGWREKEGRTDVYDLSQKPITAPATPEAATWNGYGTALKPAYEPILCFRKPLESTYAHSALTYGTAALNIDGCRVPISDGATMARNNKPGDNGWKNSSGGANNAALHGEPSGRWPANLIHSGDPEVMEVFDRAGESKSSATGSSGGKLGFFSKDKYTQIHERTMRPAHGDSGTAARFFYCAKASSSERTAGLDGNNPHPTVKPLSLCEYLARLIVPPEPCRDDAQILIPYAGSGSEAIGAMQAGWRNITGIELDAEYCEINRKRFDYWAKQAQTVQPALLEVT